MCRADKVNLGGLSGRIGNAAVESMSIVRLTQASKQVSRGEATGKLLPSRLKKHDGWHPGRWESSAGKGAASMDQCRVSMLGYVLVHDKRM